MRETQKAAYRLNRLSETMLMGEVSDWTAEAKYNYYLGFGGLGDALLLLARCWDDPQARVLFFHNNGSLCRQLFDLFDVEVFMHPNVMKSPLGRMVYGHVTSLPSYQPSAHLPDDLNFSDWQNWGKYAERMKLSVPWTSLLGKEDVPGVVVVCPSGAVREQARQRFLSDQEYRTLCGKLLVRGHTVVTLDSPENLRFYPAIGHDRSIRLTATYVERSEGDRQECGFDTMLKWVNAAVYCVSVDTWLVPYCNLNDVPLKVIRTRYNGAYNCVTEDHGNHIFLNQNLWPKMELLKAHEICY